MKTTTTIRKKKREIGELSTKEKKENGFIVEGDEFLTGHELQTTCTFWDSVKRLHIDLMIIRGVLLGQKKETPLSGRYLKAKVQISLTLRYVKEARSVTGPCLRLELTGG